MCRFAWVVGDCVAVTCLGPRVGSRVGVPAVGVVSWGFMSTCRHTQQVFRLVAVSAVFFCVRTRCSNSERRTAPNLKTVVFGVCLAVRPLCLCWAHTRTRHHRTLPMHSAWVAFSRLAANILATGSMWISHMSSHTPWGAELRDLAMRRCRCEVALPRPFST